MNNNNQLFLTATDVASIMCVSVSMGYKVIRQLNDELKNLGFVTVSGRVSKKYFETKVYGGCEVHVNACV